MAMTSVDIQNVSFSIDRKGYDVDEVDVFLEQVAVALDEMNDTITQLQMELDGDKYSGLEGEAQPIGTVSEDLLAEKEAIIADLEAQIANKRADDSVISQALIVAQRSADEIRANAREDAAQTKDDAKEEATRILDEANDAKQRILDEIEELEKDRETVREEYQTLLKDFVNSATKKLSAITPDEPNSRAARVRKPAKSSTPAHRGASTSTAAYTTPQTSTAAAAVVTPATPTPSKIEKDFSGFGDTDTSFDVDDLG